MTKRVWKKGPPPSIGWWPASAYQNADVLRWWNGSVWSIPCGKYTTYGVEERARQKASCQAEIQWSQRPKSWPARSRT